MTLFHKIHAKLDDCQKLAFDWYDSSPPRAIWLVTCSFHETLNHKIFVGNRRDVFLVYVTWEFAMQHNLCHTYHKSGWANSTCLLRLCLSRYDLPHTWQTSVFNSSCICFLCLVCFQWVGWLQGLVDKFMEVSFTKSCIKTDTNICNFTITIDFKFKIWVKFSKIFNFTSGQIQKHNFGQIWGIFFFRNHLHRGFN